MLAAAAAVAVPASAMRDILIHKGNSAGLTFKSGALGFTKAERFAAMYSGGPMKLRHYQHEAFRQMNFYQAGARIHLNVARGLGKTLWHEMSFSEIETRVLAALNTKQKRA